MRKSVSTTGLPAGGTVVRARPVREWFSPSADGEKRSRSGSMDRSDPCSAYGAKELVPMAESPDCKGDCRHAAYHCGVNDGGPNGKSGSLTAESLHCFMRKPKSLSGFERQQGPPSKTAAAFFLASETQKGDSQRSGSCGGNSLFWRVFCLLDSALGRHETMPRLKKCHFRPRNRLQKCRFSP